MDELRIGRDLPFQNFFRLIDQPGRTYRHNSPARDERICTDAGIGPRTIPDGKIEYAVDAICGQMVRGLNVHADMGV